MPRAYRLTDHFSLDEFMCPCCERVEIAYVIPFLLERIRLWIGEPLYITSAFRCPEHNREVGGAPDSLHLEGRAVDIISASTSSKELAELAYRAGFYTCIYYPKQGHTHCQLKGKAKKGLYEQVKPKEYVYRGIPA